MTDFAKVRAILDAATPGPWDLYSAGGAVTREEAS